MGKVILYDGTCGFCNQSVQFIFKRDTDAVFQFASLQSNLGQTYLHNLNIPKNIDSLVLIEDDRYALYSTAALKICRHLNGFWRLLSIILLLPRPLRDLAYRTIAKHRYKLTNNHQHCKLPTIEEKRMVDTFKK